MRARTRTASVAQQAQPEVSSYASPQGEREPGTRQPVDRLGLLRAADPDGAEPDVLDEAL